MILSKVKTILTPVFIWMLPAAILNTGCQGTSETQQASDITQAEMKLRDIFALEWLNGNELNKEVYPNAIPYIELNPRDSSIMGFTGCNRLTGNIEADENDKLEITNLGSTRMYCDGVPESEFMDALTKTNRYKREGLQLFLMQNEKIVLRFKKVD